MAGDRRERGKYHGDELHTLSWSAETYSGALAAEVARTIGIPLETALGAIRERVPVDTQLGGKTLPSPSTDVMSTLPKR